jgi:D-alanyl-D-alanine carboxypeptidase (penicillin-binding protein 5/6)
LIGRSLTVNAAAVERRRSQPDWLRPGRTHALLLVIVLLVAAGAASAARQTTAPTHKVRSASVAAAPPLTFDTTWLAAHPSPALPLNAQSAILVDLNARQVLWEKDSDSARAPASLAKMVTAMVAADHAGLDQEVTVPAAAGAVEPNRMGLSVGEIVPLRALMYGVFLVSGNDAAETLAGAIIPRSRFIAEMNARARMLGLRQTKFTNPTGLDDPGLHSSAHDLAVVAAYLVLHYPDLAAIAGSRQKSIPAGAHHGPYSLYALNKLLASYPGADGLKTGFTDEAGGCVAATAVRGGRRLVVIVLHSDVFFTDAARLLDYGFAVRV